MTELIKLKRLTVPIADVHAWKDNPRHAHKKNLERLRTQITEFGVYRPLLCAHPTKEREDWITVGGNQRLQVLTELGQMHVEIVDINTQDRAMWLKYALSDNDFVGETDEQSLAEMAFLHQEEIDAKTYHVPVVQPVPLSAVMEEYGPTMQEANEDAVPPTVPGPAKSKLGDLFQLGKHRLMCGDATNQEHVERLMDGRLADAVFTDPPYNVNYKGTKSEGILGDKQTAEEFIEFSLRFFERIKGALKPGGVYYICSGYSSYPTFVYAIHRVGLVFSCPIIWVKNSSALGWGDYRHKHEMVLKGKIPKRRARKAQPILYGWNQGAHYFKDTRYEADVWEAKKRASQSMLHPTQKPVALSRRALKNSTKEKEIVLDLFAGSGSTLIGAVQTSRICYAMELDAKYCDIIIKRYAHFLTTSERDIWKTRKGDNG